MSDLTSVELREGLWLKREDQHAMPAGVNGAKLRACQFLIGRGKAVGARHVISAASVLSPQNAMAAVVARELGMACTVIVGGSKPATALRHPALRIAAEHGATIEHVRVGYNPYLQRAAAIRAADLPAAFWLRYGITPAPEATPADLAAFHAVGANQVTNLPDEVETLVVPFGSGNTAAGVLYGLATHRRPAALRRVVLMGIGPDRRSWLAARLAALGVQAPVPLEHIDLHGSGYARYGDKMPHTLSGIVLHPTYEGKVARYLDVHQPPFWTRRDATTCLWIVGGPLPQRGAA